jgi:regulator of protease activity HflC (stomatin/prohibitin superfamily)
MEFLWYCLPSLLALLLLLLLYATIKVYLLYEYQRGLLYRRGKFVRLLGPGLHVIFTPFESITKIDMRQHYVTVSGQEVMSADNVGLKISLAARFRVVDPDKAVHQVVNYQEALYLLLQIGLRAAVGALEVEDLLVKRAEIGKQILEQALPQAAEIGVDLQLVDVKDIMFPGELKNIFAQVVNARKEGLASLERARGESAALRNLANAAHILDDNPNLRQLRLLQALEKNSGNTIVLVSPDTLGKLGKTK